MHSPLKHLHTRENSDSQTGEYVLKIRHQDRYDVYNKGIPVTHTCQIDVMLFYHLKSANASYLHLPSPKHFKLFFQPVKLQVTGVASITD